jgi:hypothetical protein
LGASEQARVLHGGQQVDQRAIVRLGRSRRRDEQIGQHGQRLVVVGVPDRASHGERDDLNATT